MVQEMRPGPEGEGHVGTPDQHRFHGYLLAGKFKLFEVPMFAKFCLTSRARYCLGARAFFRACMERSGGGQGVMLLVRAHSKSIQKKQAPL